MRRTFVMKVNTEKSCMFCNSSLLGKRALVNKGYKKWDVNFLCIPCGLEKTRQRLIENIEAKAPQLIIADLLQLINNLERMERK